MAIQLSGDTVVIGQSAFSSNATQQHKLGQKAVDNSGREFRYAKAGAVALVAGTLLQAAAEVTANQNLTAVAAAVGDTVISSTSTVTVTANQYAGGFAIITTSSGVGVAYPILSHAAYTSAAPTFTLAEPVTVALTTSSKIDLVANPYNAVVINPTTATSAPVGAAIYPIAISEFGWIQTKGPAALLADGTVTVGTAVVASNATAGAVEALTGVQAIVGNALTGIATTEYGAILLSL
jgi:hypothetical protein